MEHPEHTLSWQAIGRIILTALVILLVWMARGAFVDILISLIIAVSLYPAVAGIKRSLRVPHILSIFIVLIMVIVPFALLGFALVPLVIQGPALLTRLLAALAPLRILPYSITHFNITTYLQTHTDALLASGSVILGVSLSVITIFILAFYLIYDYERLIDLFLDHFPDAEQPKIKNLLAEIGDVTGRYVRGNLFISLICIIVVGAGLFALHVPYAIPLALFAGLLDLLPLVGSTIGAIPAVIIAFSVSPSTGFLAVILYITYQQIESAFISPIIYNKALNLSSALGFLSVIVGASLFGVLGAFLALPAAASIPVLVRYQKAYSKRHQTK